MAIRSTQAWVESLRPQVQAYTPQQLADALAVRDDLVLIDIRELQERVDRGAIEGAHHVPRGMLEFWADPALGYYRDCFDPAKEIVVHCAAGQRSVLAAITLSEMGYPRVAHLDRGFSGWVDDGLPVVDVASTSRWVRRT